MLSRSERLALKQRATSSTYTGWKRACGLGRRTSGSQRWSLAKVLRNWSSGPNITDGRNTVTACSFWAASTQASPSPLERRYWLGASAWACSALMCSRRGTRFLLHASTIFFGSSKCPGQVRPTASMVPRKTLLDDRLAPDRRHALGGAARQDHAQARL